MARDKKSILRGALALARVSELEAMILVMEIFEEERSPQRKDK